MTVFNDSYAAYCICLLCSLLACLSETAPKWTAYCAYNVYLDAQNQTQQQARQQRQFSEPAALNILLASDTSLLYSWHVCVADLLEPGRDRSTAMRAGGEVVPPSHLVGVVELPLKVNCNFSSELTFLGYR